jgi:hypothetical protein
MKLLEEAGHRTVPSIAPRISYEREPPVGPDTVAIPPASLVEPVMPDEVP